MNNLDIQNRLGQIQDRIRKAAKEVGRDPKSIRLMGVCKFQPIERIRATLSLGLVDYGNNYVQNLQKHLQELDRDLKGTRWHFIGHLQRNKVKTLLNLFLSRNLSLPMIHTLDRIDLIRQIHQELHKMVPHDPKIAGLIQVYPPSLASKSSRSGCRAEEVLPLLQKVKQFSSLWVKGLMIIPPIYENPQESAKDFCFLRQFRDDLQKEVQKIGCERIDLTELSMGMTNDLESAISEGSTIVRIGTGIFGPREKPAS
jgi:hypothetical protein